MPGKYHIVMPYRAHDSSLVYDIDELLAKLKKCDQKSAPWETMGRRTLDTLKASLTDYKNPGFWRGLSTSKTALKNRIEAIEIRNKIAVRLADQNHQHEFEGLFEHLLRKGTDPDTLKGIRNSIWQSKYINIELPLPPEKKQKTSQDMDELVNKWKSLMVADASMTNIVSEYNKKHKEHWTNFKRTMLGIPNSVKQAEKSLQPRQQEIKKLEGKIVSVLPNNAEFSKAVNELLAKLDGPLETKKDGEEDREKLEYFLAEAKKNLKQHRKDFVKVQHDDRTALGNRVNVPPKRVLQINKILKNNEILKILQKLQKQKRRKQKGQKLPTPPKRTYTHSDFRGSQKVLNELTLDVFEAQKEHSKNIMKTELEKLEKQKKTQTDEIQKKVKVIQEKVSLITKNDPNNMISVNFLAAFSNKEDLIDPLHLKHMKSILTVWQEKLKLKSAEEAQPSQPPARKRKRKRRLPAMTTKPSLARAETPLGPIKSSPPTMTTSYNTQRSSEEKAQAKAEAEAEQQELSKENPETEDPRSTKKRTRHGRGASSWMD